MNPKASNSLLTIVIPTYNHPEYIDYCLQQSSYIDQLNIRLEIHDSSPNESTRDIVSKYKEIYKNLEYIKHEDVSVDIKILTALKGVKTKYVYLCGDGLIFNAIDNYAKIQDYLKQDIDVITIYGTHVDAYKNYFDKLAIKYSRTEINYDSLTKHIKENLWYMTLYGGSIVKKEVFDEYTIESVRNMIGTGFLYAYLIYNHKYDNFRAIVLNGNYQIANICKKAPFWVTVEKRAIELWAHNFPQMIMGITPLSIEERECMIKESEEILDVFSKKKLLIYRVTNNYNYKIYKQYKADLLKYSGQSLFTLWQIAMCPKWVIKLLYLLIKRKKWGTVNI